MANPRYRRLCSCRGPRLTDAHRNACPGALPRHSIFDGDLNRDPDRRSHGRGNPRTHAIRHAHGHALAQPNPHGTASANADGDAYLNAHAHAYLDTHAHGDAHHDAAAHPRVHSPANPDRGRIQ